MKKFLRWLIHTVVKLIARVEAVGYDKLPQEGGFVIACNHLGFLDAPMAYYALDNWNLFIPVAEKWEDIPILKWLGKYLNFIFFKFINNILCFYFHMAYIVIYFIKDNIYIY